jgi:hypothetical protein
MSTYAHSVVIASHSKYWPTRKWWAATIVAIGGFLSTFASQGWHWSPVFAGAALTLVTQRVVAYLVPNDDSPGGVPGKPSN